MISVVIPTLNAEARLASCLEALVRPAVGGLVKEVIIADGGSADATLKIADGFGARIVTAPPGRGGQLIAGAARARSDWLMFLHGDTVLDENWSEEAKNFMTGGGDKAAVFTLVFDAKGLAPKIVAAGAMARTKILKSPYGDQGLLISRSFYTDIGGYKDMPLFEDVEIIRRIRRKNGRRAIHVLPANAVTSAARYERDGYAASVLKNFWFRLRYLGGAAPEELARAYK